MQPLAAKQCPRYVQDSQLALGKTGMMDHSMALAAAVVATASLPAAQVPTVSAATVALPATEPAVIPFAIQFDLPSRITGRTYRILLHRPQSAPPKDGWPVIYLLDSRSTFATAASQVLLRTSHGQNGALVVEIGYPEAAATSRLRAFDVTPSVPLPGSLGATAVPGSKPSDFGGAALFHRFMIEELRPVIAAMAPVDVKDQSLIGYSLGGLFALGVLFDHPHAYHTIVAGSPSIWFNNRELLRKEPGFAAAVKAGRVTTRVLTTSDGWEQSPPDSQLPSDAKQRAAALKAAAEYAIVDNAMGLASRLGGLRGAPGYKVRYVLFPEETHLTGNPAAVSRGVAFTFIP